MGKFFKAIATGTGFSLLLFGLGCGANLTEQLSSPATTPSITQVLPQTITAGSQTMTMKVTGTNFPTKAAILWNGAPLTTTVVDANTLTGTIGSSSLATPATVQLQVQNTQTMVESQAVPVIIAPAATTGSPSTLAVSTTSLPQGGVSAPFAATLNATGGTSPYTWSVTTGQLPAGLVLSATTGIISGTPTLSGDYSFGVTVTDASSPVQSATASLAVSIAPALVTPAPLVINTSALASGTIGGFYSALLQASGGTAPYTWSITTGSLPAGLSLSPTTGIISGTSSASGTATFTATVADTANPAQTKSVGLSIVIAPTNLTITSTVLPSGTQGATYARSLQAVGGAGPYTWSITSGALPAGLTLAASGLVSGTPTTNGNFSFGVAVKDAASPSQTATGTITLSLVPTGAPLAISSTSLPGGMPNQPYGATLNATGGTAPYAWTITGALPAGLSLSPTTGVISGTPTASGTASFTATVTDSASPAQTKSVSLSIVVAAVPLVFSPSSLPAGAKGSSYADLLQASGGNAPYTWSVTGGALPAGLTLSSGTGLISGTPTSSGTTSFTVTVKDSGNPAQTKALPLSITVAAPALTIATSSLPGGTKGTAYSGTLSAGGGTPGYTWSIAAGSLPAGLVLSPAGAISGTPTASGTSSFTATVTDAGSPAQTKSVPLSIAVAAGSSTLAITTSSLPAATKGTAYSSTVSASGGTAPYTWAITAGSLPAGLTLSPAGAIAGTPTTDGTSNFTVTVTDASNPVQTKSAALSIVVAAGSSTLAITTSSLPAATKGTAYSSTVSASGGTAPYTWAITAGSLPAGLTLSPAGAIAGTPTTNGTSNFTVTVTDASNPVQTKSAALSIVVAAGSSTLAITTSSLPAATKGTAYPSTVSASGGTAPYTWAITAGSLPAGLTLSPAGAIAGTPTTNGTSNFTVTVTDASNPVQTKSAALSIVVGAGSSALTINVTLPSATASTAYSGTMSATGGTPAYTWSITAGTLPAGLTLSATTGAISGTPTTSGTSNFTATVTDNSNPALTKSAATSIVVSSASAGPTGPGTTWYIRPDGGTRYSSKMTAGQCDGKADVSYPGSGTNQHCAFNDYRFLYDDQSYQNSAWVIAGGDTVIIRGGPYRIGVNQGSSPNDVWCNGFGNPFNCVNPTIPSGSATQPTRILGENYGSCSQSNMTQLYGGFGLFVDLELEGAQFVTVQCIELTRHSQCIKYGSPAVPSVCSSSYPIDDFATHGILTNVKTHDIVLQDMWIHGFISRGIIGPIGGTVTATNVDIAYNGAAGWDFDDGNGTPNVNGTINLTNTTIEFSGCNQAYPGTGAVSCYSQSTGGYGDGIGTPTGTCLSAHVDHSTFRYNTQDGYDMLHNDTGNCSMTITNSTSYGNNGSQFKWGPNDNPLVFENNTAVADCLRMSAPLPGQPSSYNAHLSDFCRANDALVIGFRDGGTLTMANNTIVGYAPVMFDISCWGTFPDAQGVGSCNNSSFTFENNVVLGYDNPTTYSQGGQQGGPGGFFFQEPIGVINRKNNLFFGVRGITCPTGFTSEQCLDPQLVGEPTGRAGNFVESELDNFNFHPTSASPVVGAGISIPSLTLDYSGATRPNPPSLGALEP